MRAGTLNRLVSILSPAVTSRSTDGEPILTWSTVLASVWADRQTLSGKELFAQDVRWSEVTRRYIIRYSSVVTPQCRLVDLEESSAIYEIESVIDIRDEHGGLELLVKKTT